MTDLPYDILGEILARCQPSELLIFSETCKVLLSLVNKINLNGILSGTTGSFVQRYINYKSKIEPLGYSDK